MGSKCHSSADCHDLYYCDLITQYCNNCVHICHPSVGLPGLCKQDCPDYPGTTQQPTVSTIETTLHGNTNIIEDNAFKNVLTFSIFFYFAILFVGIIIIIVYKCKNQQKHENNAEEAHEMITFIDKPSQRSAFQVRYSQAVGHPSSYSEGQYNPSSSRVEQATLNDLEDNPVNQLLSHKCSLVPNDVSQEKENVATNTNVLSDNTKESGTLKRDISSEQEQSCLVTSSETELKNTVSIQTKMGEPQCELDKFSSTVVVSDDFNQRKKNVNNNTNVTQEHPSSLTISETHLKSTASIQTQMGEPYFQLEIFSAIPKQNHERAVGPLLNLRVKNIPRKRNVAAVEEASKCILLRKEYENDTQAVDILQEAVVPRESLFFELEEEQTRLKAVGRLTVPQQETCQFIPEGAAKNIPKPGVHPNRRIYDILKSIHWVQGYYSEGESIEVYVNFEDKSQEHALSELVRITGESPEKFKVLPNDESIRQPLMSVDDISAPSFLK